ncbi:MAG: gamma-glutamyltransferase [Candidatus Eisenbacteria bacterium]
MFRTMRAGSRRSSVPPLLLFLLLAFAASNAAPTAWTRGVVASDHEIASRAGLEMLEKGGNAVDAAVATAFALSVVRPYASGIGGGGFLVVYLADGEGGRSIAIDYRERAPRAVGPNFYEGLEDTLACRFGGRSVGVPGAVAGLLHALERYGTLDRATVLAPAIRAAEEGFLADRHYVLSAREMIPVLESLPLLRERSPFTWSRFLGEGKIAEGNRILLPEQADALRLIAERGTHAFYGGPIGEAVVQAAEASGGVLAGEDLESFAVKERTPLEGEFRGKRILGMPPPSSGGIALLQILGIFDRLTGGEEPPARNSPAYVHLLVEAMKHAFADRAEWPGDPAFVEVPVERLLSGGYLDERAASVQRARALGPDAYGTKAPPPDDRGTSHFGAVDRFGNAAAGTESINYSFGSLVAVPEYGFVLNNTMDDFLTRRGTANLFGLLQSERNLPAPGKIPLSSMSPTIVLDDEGVLAVAGGSGGPRIISGTAEVLLGVVLFDQDAEEAVAAPRFHHQWMPNKLLLEPGFGREIQMALFGMGHSLERTDAVAAVPLIRRSAAGYQASSDPRKGGAPAGY